jgi:hypothetical protein
MIRITGGSFSGGNQIPLAGSVRPRPRLAQQARPSEPPLVLAARQKRDEAATHLRSAEDNLSMLDQTMGPEAALQALEEGRASLDQAQKELEEAIAQTSLKTGISE